MQKLPRLFVKVGDASKPASFNGSWWRGPKANFIPARENLQEPDAIDKYVVDGWLPDAPFLTKDLRITAFGSCFAQHISAYLQRRGYYVLGAELNLNSHIIRFGEGFVNTFVILQQLEWALENKPVSEGLWFDKEGQEVPVSEAIQKATLNLIRKTEVFIITIGLTEIWYNKQTGEPLWRAVPKDLYDEDIHGFRTTSFQENHENLNKIYALIRAHRPDAKIVFTLSPVPLMATFRPISCITANSASKAVLRAALDQFIRENEADRSLHYFPSYDIVKEFFANPFRRDNRHPKDHVIETIMETFERHYCV